MAYVVEQYFKALFTSSQPTNMEAVLDPIDRLVTAGMNHQLTIHTRGNKVSFLPNASIQVVRP